jgi:hypothetical protein
VFYDAGSVASRYGGLNVKKTSAAAGVRLHMHDATFGRLDVARGGEGWELVFRTNDPFKTSRLRRRVLSVPFAP